MIHTTGDNYSRGSDLQRHLEIALAVGRGMEFVDDFTSTIRKIISHDHASRNLFIPEMFFGIHKTLFSDTHQHPEDSHPAGEAKNPHVAGQLREALGKFVDSVFDKNGFVQSKTSDEMAHILAENYVQIRDLQPFKYGNRHTLNLFLHCIGSMPDFAERYPERIDFRRLDQNGRKWLLEGNVGDVTKAMKQAMDFERTPRLHNDMNGFGVWPSSTVNISGMPFVTHEKDGIQYLVTVNGGLVKKDAYEEKLKQFIENEKSNPIFSEFRVVPEAYLDIDSKDEAGNSIKLKDKKVVDGYEVAADGSVPLLHTGINPITGLSRKNHDRVVDYIKKTKGDKYPIYRLKEEAEAAALLKDAPDYLKPRIAYACGHIARITKQMDGAVDALFKGKKPVQSPQLVMSMGGAGSGKSSATDMIRAYAANNSNAEADNYVEASLDKAREFSDIYRVLKATNHHADDYTTIEPMASEIRRWVSERARGMDKLDKHHPDKRYNVLYDGTGIEFKGRYAKIVDAYKNCEFQTAVCMVDTMLDAPEERKDLYNQPGLERIRQRAETEKRALPWKVVTDKHSRVASSFLDAVRHASVDKAIAFCNDGPKGCQYVMAETFDPGPNVLRDLREKETTGNLSSVSYYKQCLKNDKTSVLQLLNPSLDSDQLAAKIPVLEDDNAGLLAFNLAPQREGEKGKDRILAITDMTRFIDVAEKAFINNTAAGPGTLMQPPRRVAAFIPHVGLDDKGHVRRHEASEGYVDKLHRKWKEFTSAAGNILR